MISYSFLPVTAVSEELIAAFSCGSAELDKKLSEIRSDEYITGYAFVDNDAQRIIGYCAFNASGLTLSNDRERITYPAAEIKYFAIDEAYQHRQYSEEMNFSDYIFSKVIAHLYDISENVIAIRFVLLYSVPAAVTFYKRNFFEEFSSYMENDTYRYITGCVPLYYPL